MAPGPAAPPPQLGGDWCTAVVQITSLLVCLNGSVADGRPTCRLEDIRPTDGSDMFILAGCDRLDLAHEALDDPGAFALAAALRGNREVKHLHLTHCNIKTDGAKAIAKVLSSTALEAVYLWQNEIGDDGAIAVADAVKDHPTIDTLYLGYCGITNVGAKHLAEQLAHSQVLTRLDLRSNKIGISGAKAIGAMLTQSPALKKIYLFNNDFGIAGGAHLVRAMEVNTVLSTLHAHDNGMDEHQYHALEHALERNRKLHAAKAERDEL